MAKSIYEVVTSKEIASYWNVAKQYRDPYFGESKFPALKKLGLDLSWIKGARKAPVALQLSAFDAKAIPLSRQGFEKMITEMPFFKNSMNIDEKQRQELNIILASGNQAMIDLVVNNIYNDKITLLENANLAMEMMRMQVLTTGMVSIASNGQTYSYDYGVPANHKVTPNVKWDADGADPVADINAWLDLVEQETGTRPTEILINSVTLTKLGKVASIQDAIYVFAQGAVSVTRERVKSYIEGETKTTIYVYNKGYAHPDTGAFTKFVPDGTVVLMPEGKLGNTYFGTSPEESDLMAGATSAEVTIVDTGVAITTHKEVDPVNVQTKASMICLPSCELADQIVIASVFNG